MDGDIIMEYLNLLIGNPVAWVAIISLGFNLFLMRHGYKSDSKVVSKSDLVEMKNKELDRLYSEIKKAEEKNNKLISDIEKEHADIVNELNHKIKNLENKNEIDINKIQTKKVNHW